MNKPYDSKPDTEEHILQVALRLRQVVLNLEKRAVHHDETKLESPEKEVFDAVTPKLKGLKYGSEEYKASLREMKPALDHHYAHNSHHPEHYPNGTNGMSLLDLVEMLCDWGAAHQRHDPPGNFNASFAVNIERFQITPQLEEILRNTVREMGWT